MVRTIVMLALFFGSLAGQAAPLQKISIVDITKISDFEETATAIRHFNQLSFQSLERRSWPFSISPGSPPKARFDSPVSEKHLGQLLNFVWNGGYCPRSITLEQEFSSPFPLMDCLINISGRVIGVTLPTSESGPTGDADPTGKAKEEIKDGPFEIVLRFSTTSKGFIGPVPRARPTGLKDETPAFSIINPHSDPQAPDILKYFFFNCRFDSASDSSFCYGP